MIIVAVQFGQQLGSGPLPPALSLNEINDPAGYEICLQRISRSPINNIKERAESAPSRDQIECRQYPGVIRHPRQTRHLHWSMHRRTATTRSSTAPRISGRTGDFYDPGFQLKAELTVYEGEELCQEGDEFELAETSWLESRRWTEGSLGITAPERTYGPGGPRLSMGVRFHTTSPGYSPSYLDEVSVTTPAWAAPEGEGNMFLYLNTPQLWACSTNGPDPQPDVAPLTEMRCDPTWGIEVSIDGCEAEATSYGFVRSSFGYPIYMGPTVISVDARVSGADSPNASLTVDLEIWVPDDKIQLRGTLSPNPEAPENFLGDCNL